MALFHTRPPTTSTTKDAFSHCETCPAAARKTPNGVSVRRVSKLERCLTASGNLTWDVSKGQKRLFRALFRAKIQHNFSTKYPYSTKWSYGCLPCHKRGGQIARRELTRIASTQVVVSTIAKRNGDQQVEVKQCTELKARLLELRKNLGLLPPPLKRKVFVKPKSCCLGVSKVDGSLRHHPFTQGGIFKNMSLTKDSAKTKLHEWYDKVTESTLREKSLSGTP